MTCPHRVKGRCLRTSFKLCLAFFTQRCTYLQIQPLSDPSETMRRINALTKVCVRSSVSCMFTNCIFDNAAHGTWKGRELSQFRLLLGRNKVYLELSRTVMLDSHICGNFANRFVMHVVNRCLVHSHQKH